VDTTRLEVTSTPVIWQTPRFPQTIPFSGCIMRSLIRSGGDGNLVVQHSSTITKDQLLPMTP
ncbi:hypothetical protein HDU99_010268, partial [Rhizoclosmatium hyalinum]